MESIGGAVAGETAKSIIGHLEREIGYLVHFRRDVDNLKCKFQQLTAEKSDVDQLIRVARDNNEVIKEPVNQWVKDVESVHQTDVTQLFAEAEQISSCFKGWFFSRFRLGRKAYKKLVVIQDLLDRRNKFGDTVSVPIPIPSLEHMCAYDYQEFASRKPLTKKIINALVNDDSICLVGVFGMPGIGKTKLMEALSRHVIDKKQFDEVVMVTISQNPDVKTIQNNVGNQLGMQLKDNESIYDRARHLHHRLKTQDRNILIVLDDVWKELNLEEVGIPKKSRGKSYKIVIATRVAHVCAQMRTDICFEVPILSEHDSWALFRENVGYEVNSLKLETIDRNVGYVVDSIELGTIATKLVKECAGLPLAIVTLGKALRNKPSVSVWADALRRLQKSIYQDLMPVVDSLIKLSYDFLSNEVQKKCFLFCSLFPEDYKINVKDELLVYVVGEKLLEDGVDCFDSLEETKGRLDSVVEDLISSSLLLRVYEEVGYTKMHDVIRDVAKMIAFKDEKFKHMADAVQTDLMKWPEKLESCKRLSLMRTKIRCDFPKRVEAPQLLTLILNECEGFSELPCDFFKEMKNLRNLDLSDTKITSLPSSLSFLVELVTLRLRRCYLLKNIPTVDIERFESRIERLREKKSMLKPEILDLKKSGEERFESRIERLREKMSKPGEEEERLPEEIRMFNLKKLEILDLYESGIERLPEEMGMLTNLKSLNLTKMGNLTNIPPKVISSMCQLEELYADSFQRWEIGEMGDEINANLSEVASLAKLTCMAIHIPYLESFSTNTLTHWVKLKTFRVYVTDCSNKVIWLLQTVKRFQRYLFLQIPSSISNSNEVIWFLRRADFVSLQNCNGLESVVQVDHTGGFKDNNLKCLEVRKCFKMKYLIEVEQQILEIVSFSSLEILYFEDLDNLESICNGNTLPNEFLRNLKDLEFSSCRRLSCLINWELQNLGNSCSIFSNLRRLSLYGCEEITYVLPMSVARNLNQLVDFSVVSCPKIKMIIIIDNGEDDGDNYILPRLERLSLYNLPALLSFGRPGLVFEWALKKLILIKSGKSLPSRVTQQRFSKFEVFELDDTLIHLLEDPTIINNLEHRVDDRGSYYYKKEKAEE